MTVRRFLVLETISLNEDYIKRIGLTTFSRSVPKSLNNDLIAFLESISPKIIMLWFDSIKSIKSFSLVGDFKSMII